MKLRLPTNVRIQVRGSICAVCFASIKSETCESKSKHLTVISVLGSQLPKLLCCLPCDFQRYLKFSVYFVAGFICSQQEGRTGSASFMFLEVLDSRRFQFLVPLRSYLNTQCIFTLWMFSNSVPLCCVLLRVITGILSWIPLGGLRFRTRNALC